MYYRSASGNLVSRIRRSSEAASTRPRAKYYHVNEVEQEDRGSGRGRRLYRHRRRLIVVEQHSIATPKYFDADRQPATRQPAQPYLLLPAAGEAGSAKSQRSSGMLHRQSASPGDGELPVDAGGADHPGDDHPGGVQHQGHVRARALRRAETARRYVERTRQTRDRHQTSVG